MKTIKIVCLGFLLLVTGACHDPERIVFDENGMKEIKTIQLNSITVRSIQFDPFLRDDLKDLLVFELEKSGYVIHITTVTNNTDQFAQKADAVMNVTLIHKKYYQQVEEVENISLNFDLYSKDKERICSVLFSDTSEEYLLNTGYLQEIISRMVSLLKE
ncbi:MAG: hypothetical protein JW827_03105 [Spirochaetes bacterium]|nr:hypothetical protein [Spirochaetota bacterium]